MLIVEDRPSEMPNELAVASCPDNCEYDIQLLFQAHMIFNTNVRRGYGSLQDQMLDYKGFQ